MLSPPTLEGEFCIINDGVGFCGFLESHIDREMYLFGGYESEHIEVFLRKMERQNRRTVIDVGANVGTHSIALSRYFEQVHAFEPNSGLWGRFENNVKVNRFSNTFLHKVGLGSSDGNLPFYNVGGNNLGLGTFSDRDQYDEPIAIAGTAEIVEGDSYLQSRGIERIDAVKIDVQGFEPLVLHGLRKTLLRWRPIVWLEIGQATMSEVSSRGDLEALFPFRITTLLMVDERRFMRRKVRLQQVDAEHLSPGNYLVVPKN
ncbi:FkbM family methyltransferase [Mesorhizobium sp.]|uniref:FkbM family methyltransferase n=1 Tax=Mesorhizobium sp. TaxID=1871066 RepID=UPI00257AA187|nr:FkbM family methyltransferase [Mesorhizobium sp.]